MNKRNIVLFIFTFIVLSMFFNSCQNRQSPAPISEAKKEITLAKSEKPPEKGENAMEINLKSPAFKDGERIPKQFTADGKDISPPLEWDNVPGNVESFALICDDPDAPAGVWDHWVIFNIPKDKKFLPEDFSIENNLSDGPVNGKNSWGKSGYMGPSPPAGKPHRYFFKIYALDKKLDIPPMSDKKTLENAMKDHVLAKNRLIGIYGR